MNMCFSFSFDLFHFGHANALRQVIHLLHYIISLHIAIATVVWLIIQLLLQ